MTQFLPPNLLALFAARDPIPYIPPAAKLSHEKPPRVLTGIGQYLNLFETEIPPPKKKVETRDERMERKRKEKAEQVAYKLEQEIAVWNPQENGATDPYKTLFIGRINFDTSESKLRREMESYGPVKKIVMVYNKKTGKPRGYAFVEFEKERDFQTAYKHADGKKIDGRRICVDIERGRTVKGWIPRRLGGGLGRTRVGGAEMNVKISGRDEPDRGRFRDDKEGRGDRDRGGRRERSRSRSKERVSRDGGDRDRKGKERKRSRERDRDRGVEREERDAKRDKERKRKRSRSPRDRRDKDKGEPEEGERVERRKRSRSRDKDKKRSRRSRSRDNDKKKDRRDKDREHRREKDRNKDKDKDFDLGRVKVKEEPIDDYGHYDHMDDFGGYMKPEKDMDGHMHEYEDDGYPAY